MPLSLVFKAKNNEIHLLHLLIEENKIESHF